MKKFGFSMLGVACVALSGCGAVNNAINSAIPEIDNLAQLNGANVDATVGSGRAVISGNVSRSVTFPDRDLPQVSQNIADPRLQGLKHLRVRQGLERRHHLENKKIRDVLVVQCACTCMYRRRVGAVWAHHLLDSAYHCE